MSSSNKKENNNQNASSKKVNVDWKRYEEYLEDDDLSEDQRQEFLEAVWSIIVNFVDMGFEVQPLPQIHTKEKEKSPALESGDVLESPLSKTDSNANIGSVQGGKS